MRNTRLLFYKLMATTISTATLFCALLFGQNTFAQIERNMATIGTDGKTAGRFNVVASSPQSIQLGHGAILVGIEKTDRDIIVAPDPHHFMLRHVCPGKETEDIIRLLTQSKSMFISHNVAYRSCTRFDVLYNAYCIDPVCVYDNGINSLNSVVDDLEQQIVAKDATHLFVIVRGYRNDQRRAIKQTNQLMNSIVSASRGCSSRFSPVFVLVTWPSQWSGMAANYIDFKNKADDADEVGLVPVNYLVNCSIAHLRSRIPHNRFKTVMVGHSLGARVITRAVYSSPIITGICSTPADLVIGLQPAFSLNRFICQQGIEGSPYKRHRLFSTPVVLTNSKNDKVLGLTAVARYGGGTAAANKFEQDFPKNFVGIKSNNELRSMWVQDVQT